MKKLPKKFQQFPPTHAARFRYRRSLKLGFLLIGVLALGVALQLRMGEARAQTLAAPLPGEYTLVAVHSKKCMEVANSSTVNGGNVQQRTCTPGAPNQEWLVEDLGTGLYKLTNVNSGKVLDVNGASLQTGANIFQWDWNNGNNQKWTMIGQSDGSYVLRAAHSNKCADVASVSTADNANIYQWDCHFGNNQRFRLIPAGLETLKGIPIPQDANLSKFVVDMQAAKVLGKALFWDAAVGSDGKTACATCHFHAGVDVRSKNQLSPALAHTAGAPLNSTFNPTLSGKKGGPNYRIQPADFPFFVLADANNRDSQITFQTDDVMSSQGVYPTHYVGTSPGAATDNCNFATDNRFQVGGISTRRAEPRHTPSVINAIFNLRNFWDGRANETFNGVNPFGTRDTSAGIYRLDTTLLIFQSISKVQPNLSFASLASQAVGPPLSDFEMSCAGRIWPNVGRRLLNRTPLQNQPIAANDSLLAAYRSTTGSGLTLTYQQLVNKAFASQYRNNSWKVTISGTQYNMSEANFSFFFGLALQLYQGTLVSDNAPLDQYITGSNPAALSAQELRGMSLFTGKAGCIECHAGPELTNAGTLAIRDFKAGAIVSFMAMGDGQNAIYDEGFYNIGVRPTVEDLGVGATDPFGNPLSFAAQYKARLATGKSFVDKRLTVNPCSFEINPCATPPASVRVAVDGAFKTPTLRNVELTGPFFHNGSRMTLEQVVEFYNRGGDRRGTVSNNTSGFGSNGSNLDAEIVPLGLTAQEQADLVAFLKRPLTDNRVRCDQAPFDHPQLVIPNGHVGDNNAVVSGSNGVASEDTFTLPAVGSNGMCAADLSGGRLSFQQILANGGLASSQDEQGLPADLPLNEPVNPDSPAHEDVVVAELPVEEIVVESEPYIVIEEEVPAVFEEEQNTDSGEQNFRVFLPTVNNQ